MDTFLSVGKQRTVTLKALIDKATGLVIPPDCYEVVGWVQSRDGGNLQSPGSTPSGATFKCVGTKVGADYKPPQPALVQALIQFTKPIRIGMQMALLDSANSSSLTPPRESGFIAQIVWSDEK